MGGEGVSLTHDEWKYASTFLNIFPIRLSAYLLNGVSSPLMEPILVDFVDCLLANHPLTGKLRICNKILPLLQFSNNNVHARIKTRAKELQGKISIQRDDVYKQLLDTVNIQKMEEEIKELSANTQKTIVNQASLTGCPPWYSFDDAKIPTLIITELLMGSRSKVNLSQIYTMMNQTIRKVKPGPTQSQIIDRLTTTFAANYILLKNIE